MKAWGSKRVFRGEEFASLERWRMSEFHGPSVQRPFLQDSIALGAVQTAESIVGTPSADVPEAPSGVEDALPDVPVGPTPEELEALKQGARVEGYREGFEKGRVDGYAAGLVSGRDDGNQKGFEEGSKRAEAAVRAEVDQIAALVRKLEDTVSGYDEALAGPVTDLALEVARHLLREELAIARDRISAVVREALAGLPDLRGPLRLALHPDDLALCQKHFSVEILRDDWRLEASAELDRGGCRICSESLEVDLTLPERWRRIVDVLGRDIPWTGTDEC